MKQIAVSRSRVMFKFRSFYERFVVEIVYFCSAYVRLVLLTVYVRYIDR